MPVKSVQPQGPRYGVDASTRSAIRDRFGALMILRPYQDADSSDATDLQHSTAGALCGAAVPLRVGEHVRGELNFLGEMSGKPTFHVHDRSKDRITLVATSIRVANARHLRHDAALDVEGFCLVRQQKPQTEWNPTAITRWDPAGANDWSSFERGMRVHAAAIERLILETTGASRAFVTPVGVVRIAERSSQVVRSCAHRPARFVHSDYSDASANAWAFMLLGPRWQQRHRCAVYNAWRVLTPPPQDASLALCDARTVHMGDGALTDAIQDYPGMQASTFETTVYRHNDQHRWYYYPGMTEDEVVLFKGFDSDPDRAHRVPHSAFDNPTCPLSACARVSIDFRVLASFPRGRS
jgi:hypothetical protein